MERHLFYCHRQFLPINHSYRKQRDTFKRDIIEKSLSLPRLSGDELLQRVRNLPDIIFGIQSGKQKISNFGTQNNWVKMSIIWELPYWHINLI